MDLVFPAWVPGAAKLADALPAVASQGVVRVEWGLGSTEYFDERDPKDVAAARAALDQTGIRACTLHSRFGEDADLASLDPVVRQATIAVHLDAINVARRLGARYLVVHPGHGPCGDHLRERLAYTRDGLRALEPAARMAGVVLALENLPPAYPGSSAAELLAILEEVGSPCLGICFDTGHAHLTGDLPGLAQALLPHAVTMHLHDNDGKADQHLLPGRGTIDWPDFARLYQETGCTALGTLECAPPDGWTWSQCEAAVRGVLGSFGQ